MHDWTRFRKKIKKMKTVSPGENSNDMAAKFAKYANELSQKRSAKSKSKVAEMAAANESGNRVMFGSEEEAQ